MIVGNGMLAKYFEPFQHEDVVYFCSGVSNSKTSDETEFEREINLLFNVSKNSTVVYTSSISVKNLNTAYQKHKMVMEELVKKFNQYLILRVGNLVGKNQQQWQFFPCLFNQIKNGAVYVGKHKCDLLSVLDYVKIVHNLLINKNFGVFELCSKKPPNILDVVRSIEGILGVKPYHLKYDDEEILYNPDVITGDEFYYLDVIERYFYNYPV